MELIVYGPYHSHLAFIDPSFNSNAGRFRPDTDKVDRHVGMLMEIVDRLADATYDWEYRDQDEHEPILTALRKEGFAIVSAMAGNAADRPRLVDILSSITHLNSQSDRHLPWEFLYLGDETGPVDLQKFFGANAVVGREFSFQADLNKSRPSVLQGDKGPLTHLPAGTPLLFGYAEDNRLMSARSGAERNSLSRLGITLEPLPKLSPAPARKAASKEQFNSFLSISEQLTHFNCHADASRGLQRGAIYVSDQFKIDEEGIDEAEVCPGSIIVLNCCNGHTMLHSEDTTTAMRFMSRRPQAVVATTAKIDDRYATRWAGHFYAALIGGAKVSQSILAARQQMLAETVPCPSALLYAYVGVPSAGLRRTDEAAE